MHPFVLHKRCSYFFLQDETMKGENAQFQFLLQTMWKDGFLLSTGSILYFNHQVVCYIILSVVVPVPHQVQHSCRECVCFWYYPHDMWDFSTPPKLLPPSSHRKWKEREGRTPVRCHTLDALTCTRTFMCSPFRTCASVWCQVQNCRGAHAHSSSPVHLKSYPKTLKVTQADHILTRWRSNVVLRGFLHCLSSMSGKRIARLSVEAALGSHCGLQSTCVADRGEGPCV